MAKPLQKLRKQARQQQIRVKIDPKVQRRRAAEVRIITAMLNSNGELLQLSMKNVTTTSRRLEIDDLNRRLKRAWRQMRKSTGQWHK